MRFARLQVRRDTLPRKKDLLTSPIATDRSAVGLFSAFEAVAVFTVVVRVSGSRNMTHAVFLRRLQRFAGDVA